MQLGGDSELRFVQGVGPRRGAALADAGLVTVEDLLYALPFRYEDRRRFATVAELKPDGPPVTLDVMIRSSRLIRTRRRGFTIFEAVVSDAGGEIKAIWYNQPYLERVLRAGTHAVLFGSAGLDRSRRLVLENPEYEFVDESDAGIHTGRIVPVYRRRGEVTPRQLRLLAYRVLEGLTPEALPSLVPDTVRRRHRQQHRVEALRDVHFPPDGTALDDLAERRTPAQRALVFEEVFLLQLALALRRDARRRESRGIAYRVDDGLRARLAALLPFRLTAAQRRVISEIGADLRSSHPMNRLLQGDVGSGKTIVAFLTMLVAVENGHQAALMAPTEILAEQHAANLRRLLADGTVERPVGLLTGSLRAAARREALARVADGSTPLVVGTHALFEAGVDFPRLGLVVIDEQHRFGVLQRAALAAKGGAPDVLVMTATPIPRSLALTVYGDLDVSVIDELPPGRTPVRTVVRRENRREEVWAALRREIEAGRQAYVVVPLVEETERSDLKAAVEFAESLRRGPFADLSIGLLHGRMKADEKDATMRRFAGGELPILVATTVIEVGVDVPNATAMVVEHAERFGLSQLHQLRGRVGRGSDSSLCVLMVGDGPQSQAAAERLGVMTETNDGFRIAETDLRLRGPGAVFGTHQHGLSDMQFLAEALKTPALLQDARSAAADLVRADRPAALALLLALPERWKRRLNLAEVG